MNLFHQPDLDEQRRRITHLARVALDRYALAAPRLTFLSDTDNTVYRVDAAGAAYALRICNPVKYCPEAILAELSWLAAIRRDTTLVVPEPVPARDGRLLQSVSAEGVPEPRRCVLFCWVEGEFRDQDLTPPRCSNASER
jgi:Ser/Thr protein kinase RdoA (MazF antagonist)